MTEVGENRNRIPQESRRIRPEFITYLAANAIRIGVVSSVDFYLKRRTEDQAAVFLNRLPRTGGSRSKHCTGR